MKTHALLLLLISTVFCMNLHGEDAQFQKVLLPLDVNRLLEKARAELLKLQPDLKATDLKFSGVMYHLNPEPDYAIHQKSDGTEKKVFISDYYEQLNVTFALESTARKDVKEGRSVTIKDTLSVNFPNGRSKEFTVSKGTNTQYE